MLEKIKKIMGFNNNEFDDVINTYIESAKLDLKQVGIVDSKINGKDGQPDSLVCSAIVSYVLSFLDIPNAELYSNAYSLQKDSLRHYSSYTVENESEGE